MELEEILKATEDWAKGRRAAAIMLQNEEGANWAGAFNASPADICAMVSGFIGNRAEVCRLINGVALYTALRLLPAGDVYKMYRRAFIAAKMKLKGKSIEEIDEAIKEFNERNHGLNPEV